MLPSFNGVDYNAVYSVEVIDAENIKLIATSNNGDNVTKTSVAKVNILAGILQLKSVLSGQKTEIENRIAFLNNLVTTINEAE